MADVKLRFVIPCNELSALYDMMEADKTPQCELRIKKSTAPQVICDIVTDGSGAGVRDIEIITDEDNTGYFREMLGGGILNNG